MQFPVRPRAAIVLTLASAPVFGACVVPAHAPPPPRDPQQVYLLIEGEHTGIVLPTGPGRWLEYSYADWGWVVEGKSSSSYAMYALMNPTPGALGRREIEGPPPADPIYASRGSSFQPFLAERDRVTELERELESAYTRDGATPFHNDGFDLTYVPALQDYELKHHCAHATIAWLQVLGCDVHASGIVRSVKLIGITPQNALPAPR